MAWPYLFLLFRYIVVCELNFSIFQVWRIADKKGERMVNKHGSQISALEFSRDGRFLLSAGCGESDLTVRIWNMETYRDIVQPVAVNFLSFVRDTNLFFGWLARTTAHRLQYCKLQIWSRMVAFSPKGHIFAIARDAHVFLLDAERNVVLEKLVGRTRTAIVTSVAFTADGRGLISGTLTGDVKLWDLSPMFTMPQEEDSSPLEPGQRWGELKCVEITYPGVRGEVTVDVLSLKLL